MSIRWKTWTAVGVLATAAAWWPGFRTAEAQQKAGGDGQALVKRGDYLVNQVARCGDCHTPRDG